MHNEVQLIIAHNAYHTSFVFISQNPWVEQSSSFC